METKIRFRSRSARAAEAVVAGSLANWVTTNREQLSSKLRISLTDACNLGCFFCHNEGQGLLGTSRGSMSPADVAELVRAAVLSGVSEIKLTGGEPLLYQFDGANIVDVVREINYLRKDLHFGLSMTSNGLLLGRFGEQLKDAGLDRVTVSLHTLSSSTFARTISSRGAEQKIETIRSGLMLAAQVGLTPLKVNMVLFAGDSSQPGNLKEVGDVVRLAREAGASELRLYTLLRSDAMTDDVFASRYQYWSAPFNSSLAKQFGIGDHSLIADQITEFASRWSRSMYPKPTLLLDLEGISVSIEAMEDGRFEEFGLPAEGPYALRLSADGMLRGFLSDARSKDVLRLLRSGSSPAVVTEVFTEARRDLLPPELVRHSRPA